jgi:hypothetical protein
MSTIIIKDATTANFSRYIYSLDLLTRHFCDNVLVMMHCTRPEGADSFLFAEIVQRKFVHNLQKQSYGIMYYVCIDAVGLCYF